MVTCLQYLPFRKNLNYLLCHQTGRVMIATEKLEAITGLKRVND